jgi:ABC-type multidrug transport system fused ATPase/permease subunit
MPVLFRGSIRANVLWGRPDASEAEIRDALAGANALEFCVRLAEGAETEVGGGGSQLSGGQRQRIAIARAIIRDPAVLVLDEATAALDSESEVVVQAALDRLIASGRKRTTLVIAHRLSTIRNATRIVVLQNNGRGGEVLEVGSHDELMAKSDGLYTKLWRIGQGAAVQR